ncbi:hypothetical protein [Deinococcus apachensis]|uniref:hypothetical protein n=1 Tax=Deinococcus apachensis TaxID=309886 RepID=UPI00036ECBCE|nr:hypothetical protein [Deinococcus apachensis]
MQEKQFQLAGVSGIVGGTLYLFFSGMHIVAHGLDASPDHAVVLGVSQDAWYALGLLPYPLQVFTLLTAVQMLEPKNKLLSRVLLSLALFGLCTAAVGHAILSMPYTGDWRTAPSSRIGWPTWVIGYGVFALGSLLGAITARANPQLPRLRPQVGLLGLLLLASFAAGMADRDDGFEFTLLPTLLFGLAWVWLARSLTHARRCVLALERA